MPNVFPAETATAFVNRESSVTATLETSSTGNILAGGENLHAASTAKPRKALLHGLVTLSSAENREEDIRAELQYVMKIARLYDELKNQEKEIQQLVAAHCGLGCPDHVRVPDMWEPGYKHIWRHGSFNVCIPITIASPGRAPPAKVAFRVPLPFKIGEAFPGNAEEKIRTEAATYIWVNENCPDIPIPRLRGFGVPGGLSFFGPECVPFWQRIKTFLFRSFFRKHGYMLLDWIENDGSQMLSNTFGMPQTQAQTQNLYRGLSNIMISLARLPQPRIGSWTIDYDGRILLSNRPMFCHLHQLENWAISSGIPRDTTYTSTGSLYLDLLTGHDNRLKYQRNSAVDAADARAQAKDLVLMRALLRKYTSRNCNEPFVMQLTDINASNTFVDEDWNIKHLVDLEWTSSLSLEFFYPPFWLTGKSIDEITESDYEQFKVHYNKFTRIFEEEDMKTPLYHKGKCHSRTNTMASAFSDGRYWYLKALQTPKGLFNIFRDHLQPRYDTVSKEILLETVSTFLAPDMTSFVNSKLEGHAQYRQQVREIFHGKESGRPC
ncbi:hypothetical protein AJ79_07948 [Helicocarpus griseus UAMH5409]|uniref:Aminoglycoside phosphotransferase domain-containing protein n=1 Tax=Helicocarpus griseus UAMH5409 TaxID=1447875 RepID=A0A2B7WXR2_9EURO|nr:hypothetical protein AJ79_07948 [Helicocarpus griseus UAMH5409]